MYGMTFNKPYQPEPTAWAFAASIATAIGAGTPSCVYGTRPTITPETRT